MVLSFVLQKLLRDFRKIRTAFLRVSARLMIHLKIVTYLNEILQVRHVFQLSRFGMIRL